MARRVGLTLAIAALLFVVATLATARWGDRSLWPPAPGAPTTEVFIVSHGYHAGIIVPRAAFAEQASRRGLSALGYLATRFADIDRLEIGWGDEGFYREAPTAESVTIALAMRALFRPGNPSVLHVVGVKGDPRAVFANSDLVRVDISDAGFVRLTDMLDATFARSKGSFMPEVGPVYSFAPTARFISSTSAIIGSPTCSMPLGCRRRPYSRPCRLACCSISNGVPASFGCHRHPRPSLDVAKP